MGTYIIHQEGEKYQVNGKTVSQDDLDRNTGRIRADLSDQECKDFRDFIEKRRKLKVKSSIYRN